ncbi:MAG: DUF6448 family protein [Thermoanaerobaculaceae bacterium]|jgi:hypothetical protein|nr:DUF6448 family protein [Thermoanaerobaculaceae bacterium]
MSSTGLLPASLGRVLGALTLLWLPATLADAHCDTLDGPVVMDARLALERADATPVLKWVRADDEPEIRAAFKQVMAVRSASPAARELADRYFFETLVRIHRAGEGAPYTGLKPAGTPVDPAVRLADAAIAAGSPADLEKALAAHLHETLTGKWQRLVASRPRAGDDLVTGRAWVAAYVDFVHFAEGVHQVLVGSGGHSDHSAPGTAPQHEH